MTKEEKAKAYEEALERAKEIMNNTCSSETTKAACQEIFPELAESEDERIRMELCDIVRDMPYMETELRAHGLTVEKTLAYLEKQKGQKPFNVCEQCIALGGGTAKEKVGLLPGRTAITFSFLQQAFASIMTSSMRAPRATTCLRPSMRKTRTSCVSSASIRAGRLGAAASIAMSGLFV